MKMLFIIFQTLFFSHLSFASYPVLELNPTNHTIVHGVVTFESAQTTITALLDHEGSSNSEPFYLVIDTPGGVVDAGAQIVNVLRIMKTPIEVIVIQAFSMGFILTQAVSGTRHILPTGKMMTHLAKTMVPLDEIPLKLLSFLNGSLDIITLHDEMTAKRLGLSKEDYLELEKKEIFFGALGSIEHKMADDIIHISCSKEIDSEQCPLYPLYDQKSLLTLPF